MKHFEVQTLKPQTNARHCGVHWAGGDRRVPGTGETTSLAYRVSSRLAIDPVSKGWVAFLRNATQSCSLASTCVHTHPRVHQGRTCSLKKRKFQSYDKQPVHVCHYFCVKRGCRITWPSHESLVLQRSRLYSSSHFSPAQLAALCFFTTVPGKGQICVPILDSTTQ